MSGKGNCYDNAVAESFFATLKNERVWFRRYSLRVQARMDIVDYIFMYYNCKRLHSTLGYLSAVILPFLVQPLSRRINSIFTALLHKYA